MIRDVPEIARPSVASLCLQLSVRGTSLGTATGFLVERDEVTYLVTNFHVVSGRHPETHANERLDGAWPDSVRILHNAAGHLGKWHAREEMLYGADGRPLWLEHPGHGSRVDVVALPLTDTAGIERYAYDPWGTPDLAVPMAGSLSIVGFPFEVAYGGAMATWVQGFVASEPRVDVGGLPRFLVDSRTCQGQSGSAVVFFTTAGTFLDLQGNSVSAAGVTEVFVGVYSGRIHSQSDLGYVWRASAVREIIAGQFRGIVLGP
jgi:hypothetical protein